jgi:hypothetical protein
LKIEVNFETDTIDNVKAKIQDMSSAIAGEFHLVFRSKACEPYRRLREFELKVGEVLYMKTILRGGMGKRAKAEEPVDLNPHADDPQVVAESLGFRAPAFGVFLSTLQDVPFASLKDYVMKCKHGERVLEYIQANTETMKRLEDYIH